MLQIKLHSIEKGCEKMKSSKIATQIGKYRTKKKMTQTELGKALHVSKNTIEKWENGRNAVKDYAIVELADFFGISCDELLTDTQPKNSTLTRELGLSDQTITELCSIQHMSKLHEDQPEQQSYYQNKLKVLDLLINDQSLLDTIAGYLFRDFSEFHVINETGLYTATLTKNGTFTEADNAALFKLRIMDRLSALRDSLKGGNAK